jgi:hypothetical protein
MIRDKDETFAYSHFGDVRFSEKWKHFAVFEDFTLSKTKKKSNAHSPNG